MTKPKSNRGGARVGAGRPKEDVWREKMQLTLRRETVVEIKARARAKGWRRGWGKVVDEAIAVTKQQQPQSNQ